MDLLTGGNYVLFHLIQLSGSEKGDFMSSTNRQANDQRATPLPSQDPATGSKHAVEPSGPKGDNTATAGSGPTKVQSGTPENRLGRINPSAPEDSNTTPGTTREK